MSTPSIQQSPSVRGVWLPIVTPFIDGAVDFESYEGLVAHYLKQNVSGIIPLGTTGEGPSVEAHEVEAIVDLTLEIVDGRIPVFVGIGGNSTHKVTEMIRRLERLPFDGILAVCPYYNRPPEDGVREHFREIARSTDRPVLLYNIPYRTGINLSNDSVLELSEITNIRGIKDSCANLAQTVDLLRRRPAGFSVMTGEDAMFYTTLALGGDGGILASAHFEPSTFVQIFKRMSANDHQRARSLWHTLEAAVRLLFKEPNPMPIKHWLWRRGLIRSSECRLPLTRVSEALGQEIEAALDPACERVSPLLGLSPALSAGEG